MRITLSQGACGGNIKGLRYVRVRGELGGAMQMRGGFCVLTFVGGSRILPFRPLTTGPSFVFHC